ncbi:hypothetical protein I79_019344 [Cricetulus griseus]|uniref:Uncharacterized protein n=1 Tax=Cricetulus griseus TaxID=10029 RepID=G3I759_CRIGR|nr:hypothetical protein I79_019344 [Cricetulus griseus]
MKSGRKPGHLECSEVHKSAGRPAAQRVAEVPGAGDEAIRVHGKGLPCGAILSVAEVLGSQ